MSERRIVEYQVVRGVRNWLVTVVNEEIADGWELFGGPMVEFAGTQTMLLQAMVRYEGE